MSIPASRLAFAAFGVLALMTVTQVASAQEIADIGACNQAVKDAMEAKAQNPAIGDSAEQMFNSLVAEARKLCDEGKFAEARQHLSAAKGMVASE